MVITKVGRDLGDERLTWLSRNGIDLKSSAMSAKPTTRFRIVYSNGQRSMQLTARCDVIADSLLREVDADALLISPIANELRPTDLKACESLKRTIVDLQGFLRVFDEDGRMSISRFDLRGIPESFLLKVNREELYALTGTLDLSASARILLRSGRRYTVTLEEQGALLIEPEAAKLIRPVTSVVAEPTGLGDIFSGALAVGWARTGDLVQAVKLGVAAASVSRGEGLSKIPSKDEVTVQMERLSVKTFA